MTTTHTTLISTAELAQHLDDRTTGWMRASCPASLARRELPSFASWRTYAHLEQTYPTPSSPA
jgi:hypothetical protein